MAIQVPQTVRQAWGDEVVTEFVPWLEQTIEEKTFPRLEQLVEEKAVPRDEYRQVLSRLDVLEHDVADIKTDVRELRGEIGNLRAEMNTRFDRVNERFVDMERHFETRFDQMSERMLVQTRWLIGSIALFGTILTILQAIAQFTP
jgi:tetrahydromethanopterin S-methyltransferase subunit G